jgi:hypothetical protein
MNTAFLTKTFAFLAFATGLATAQDPELRALHSLAHVHLKDLANLGNTLTDEQRIYRVRTRIDLAKAWAKRSDRSEFAELAVTYSDLLANLERLIAINSYRPGAVDMGLAAGGVAALGRKPGLLGALVALGTVGRVAQVNEQANVESQAVLRALEGKVAQLHEISQRVYAAYPLPSSNEGASGQLAVGFDAHWHAFSSEDLTYVSNQAARVDFAIGRITWLGNGRQLSMPFVVSDWEPGKAVGIFTSRDGANFAPPETVRVEVFTDSGESYLTVFDYSRNEVNQDLAKFAASSGFQITGANSVRSASGSYTIELVGVGRFPAHTLCVSVSDGTRTSEKCWYRGGWEPGRSVRVTHPDWTFEPKTIALRVKHFRADFFFNYGPWQFFPAPNSR